MSGLEIRVLATGLEDAERRLHPQRVYEILTRWFDEAPRYVRDVMRQRAPAIVRGRVKIKKDAMRPPKWALVGSTHPLAHIFEGGTGSRGAAGFRHGGRHFPRVTGAGGLMETTGLPRPKAFAMAQSIAEAGGLAPQPFVAPTADAVRGRVVGLMEQIVDEVTR